MNILTKKQQQAANAFKTLMWANDELATGSGWHIEGEPRRHWRH